MLIPLIDFLSLFYLTTKLSDEEYYIPSYVHFLCHLLVFSPRQPHAHLYHPTEMPSPTGIHGALQCFRAQKSKLTSPHFYHMIFHVTVNMLMFESFRVV